MSKKVGYKASSPNTNKGLKTHGSFPNAGQKLGKKSLIKNVGEKNVDPGQMKFMKKVVNDLRKQGKRRIQMMPDSGAFH